MVICSQLHILNDSLENIYELALLEINDKPNTTVDTSERIDEILNKKLQECIQHHTCILE